MAKPTDLAPWATDANYPAGSEPEAGTPTKVAYTLGQATVGWRPKGKLPAQELNTWMHRVGAWIAWFNGLFGSDSTLTLEADAHVVLSGAGRYKHGLVTKIIPAIGGQSSSVHGVIAGSGVVRTGASGGTFYRAVDIDAGKRIVNIRVRLKENAGGTTCTAKLVRAVDGVQSDIATVGISAGTAVYQTLTVLAVNHTVITGGQYLIAFTFGGGAANCDLDRIEIDYDNP